MEYLSEELRILAGLQETKVVDDPLKKYLAKQKKLDDDLKLRKENMTKSILTDFSIFEEKIDNFKYIIDLVQSLNEPDQKTEFLNGLLEHRYQHLKVLSDKIINDNIFYAIKYLEEEYDKILDELETIVQNVSKNFDYGSKSFFASKDIFSNDIHGLKIIIFKDKSLSEKIDNKIEYGSEVIALNNGITMIKNNGKRYYSFLSLEDLELLEKNNYLI